jgi:glycosyltransferase involved in cell wall biosynthesis
MRPGDPIVGYLPKGFPRISETFITNEVLHLERLGLEIRMFPLKRPEGDARQANVSEVRAPVQYLPEKILLALPRLALVHAALCARRPRAYAKTLGYTLSRCVRQRSTSTLRRFFQAGWLVGRALRGQRIAHFHAHFCHGPATVAMFTKWLTGIPYSFTAHAKDLYLTERDILRDKMREAEFVVTCTTANQHYLEELGGDLVPVHRIYHGLDLERFVRSGGAPDQIVPLAAFADGGRVPVLLSVGRLVDKKGFDTLLRACALLRDRGQRFRCLIYGDGPKRAELEALIRDLALGDVVSMPGAILQDELVDVYRQATVFALPCQVLDNGDRDGLPNVIVEAMAMEVPVVSTAVSGVPELVESGVNGLLVKPRAVGELADAIEILLRDPALRRRMARAGRERVVAEFEVGHNTRRLLALFHQALGLGPVEPAAADPDALAPAARRERTP